MVSIMAAISTGTYEFLNLPSQGNRDTTQILRYMRICRQLSEKQDYLNDKPGLIDKLLQIALLVDNMKDTSFDHEVVWLIGDCIQIALASGFNVKQHVEIVLNNYES